MSEHAEQPQDEAADLVDVRIRKPFDGYQVGDLDQLPRDQALRWAKKGRLFILETKPVDRSKLAPAPPPVDGVGTGFQFKQRRLPPTGTSTAYPPDFYGTGPSVTPVDGPDVQPSTGPDEQTVEIVTVKGGWYRVVINGITIAKDDGKPRHFRKDDAEAFRDEYLRQFA